MTKPPVIWRPPRSNFTKINCNASFGKASGKGNVGIVFRDDKGIVLTAMSKPIFASSPLIAEALSLREAVSLACNLNLQSVILESDNQQLIEACRGNLHKAEIRGIVEDIKNLRARLRVSVLTWVNREDNEVAHTIATMARDNLFHGSWIRDPPDKLRRVIVRDMQAHWR